MVQWSHIIIVESHFIVFLSFIDTHSIFQGKYEFMIQFYISDISFVVKYI